MSILSSVNDLYERIFNPFWYSAKKEMDQAVESISKVATDKEEFSQMLHDAGYQTGSIISEVGESISSVFKGTFSFLKWVLLAGIVLFVLWVFFGRKT